LRLVSLLASSLRANRPDVIDDVFDGEAVLVNLRTGRYYSLNAAGSEVWQQVLDGADVEAMVTHFRERQPEAADGLEGVLCSYLELLLDEGLLVGTLDRATTATTNGTAPAGFAPSLQIFTDMVDLLLLDPIHEVDLDGTGWPSLAAPLTT
jgi:hypothetical protein